MQIARWGNSLALRIPASVVKALDLREGDEVTVDIAGARQFEISAKPDLDALLARLHDLRGRIPADFRFDRLEANAR